MIKTMILLMIFFYNSIIFLLESKSLHCNVDKQIIQMKESNKIDKYYYEPQLTGDCTMRSFILPLYYYSKVINKSFNNFFTELLFLLRLVLFLKVTTKNFDVNNSNIYYVSTYAYNSLKHNIKSMNIIDIFNQTELNNCINEVYIKQLNVNNNSDNYNNLF